MRCPKAYAGVHSSILSLNLSSNLWCRSRSRRSYSFLRPSLCTGIATKNEEDNSLSFRPYCSLCDDSLTANGGSLPRGISEAVKEKNHHNKFLQVVLVSPQIPGNVGSIARTCAASAVGLHLVEPLGFQIDDTKLKRAGLDYWPYPGNFYFLLDK